MDNYSTAEGKIVPHRKHTHLMPGYEKLAKMVGKNPNSFRMVVKKHMRGLLIGIGEDGFVEIFCKKQG